ncbi:unnamed protein product [Vicia faba]|uniref:Uncharacterized protein n=1 Tax=Vicia faba TaxID=3906 RepID=A0AAV1A258_VICFA|nr:unnamed protein product [Vicia faba]
MFHDVSSFSILFPPAVYFVDACFRTFISLDRTGCVFASEPVASVSASEPVLLCLRLHRHRTAERLIQPLSPSVSLRLRRRLLSVLIRPSSPSVCLCRRLPSPSVIILWTGVLISQNSFGGSVAAKKFQIKIEIQEKWLLNEKNEIVGSETDTYPIAIANFLPLKLIYIAFEPKSIAPEVSSEKTKYKD